ncbi:hypothetical protein Droror1_Dr00011764 [Drosera rotundifolia]
MDLILIMPMKPAPSILKSLISACKIQGNTEIAMRASQKLLELYPNDPGTYVLMSSSLATGGLWGEAAGLEDASCELDPPPGFHKKYSELTGGDSRKNDQDRQTKMLKTTQQLD